jgi:hypothetical protein
VGPVTVWFARPYRLQLSATPNPFLESTEIRWQVISGSATLDLFDLSGRRIWTNSVERSIEPQILVWDGVDQRGEPVPAGIYYLRLRQEGGQEIVRKLMRLR